MKMQFIGENNSLGYKTGHIYEVHLKTDNNVIVLYCKGHVSCPYGSIKALLKNWKELNH